uniref:Myeloid leukemia factor n=1 Tax=Phlebotomus papatasi TaxID=29031 RepID=A0A1B0CYP9_PHLPP
MEDDAELRFRRVLKGDSQREEEQRDEDKFSGKPENRTPGRCYLVEEEGVVDRAKGDEVGVLSGRLGEADPHRHPQEERQDFINLDEDEAEDFDREFMTKSRSSMLAVGGSPSGTQNPQRELLALPAPPPSSAGFWEKVLEFSVVGEVLNFAFSEEKDKFPVYSAFSKISSKMFGSSMLNDFDDDPFFGHHLRSMRQMSNMMNSLLSDPFGMFGGFDSIGGGAPALMGGSQTALTPFGFPNINRLLAGPGSFMSAAEHHPGVQYSSSSSFVSMTSGPDGRPHVYQASSSTKTGPGGLRETQKTIQDSRTDSASSKIFLDSFRVDSKRSTLALRLSRRYATSSLGDFMDFRFLGVENLTRLEETPATKRSSSSNSSSDISSGGFGDFVVGLSLCTS